MQADEKEPSDLEGQRVIWDLALFEDMLGRLPPCVCGGRLCLARSEDGKLVDKQQGHDYLRRLILVNLDYTTDGNARNLLQLWMTSGTRQFRLYATCLLRALLRADVTDFKDWGIELLVTQLNMEEEVAAAALSVLDEAAQRPLYLRALIAKRPILVQLARTASLLE